MRYLYNKVAQILNAVNFNDIWDGFSRYEFALYDENTVYLEEHTIPRDNRFLGNTAIDYEGRLIAIWKILNPLEEDEEELASNLVHEMFHVFQGSNNETRYPNDLVMLNYPDLLDNFRAKRIENLALYKAFFAKGQDEKGDYLNQFIAIREYRKSIIGDIITQEYYTETIEGLAEYAGCMALKQISSKKYEKRMKDYIGKLVILDNNFFDHRRLLYYSGAVFCIILKEMNINIHHQIGSTAKSFFEIISEKFIPKSFTLDREDDDLLNIFKEYVATKGERFTTFLKEHNNKIDGDFVICGYDPMNMIKMNNKILCYHFIMLHNEQQKEPLFIKGPLMLFLEEGTNNRVYAYII